MRPITNGSSLRKVKIEIEKTRCAILPKLARGEIHRAVTVLMLEEAEPILKEFLEKHGVRTYRGELRCSYV